LEKSWFSELNQTAAFSLLKADDSLYLSYRGVPDIYHGEQPNLQLAAF